MILLKNCDTDETKEMTSDDFIKWFNDDCVGHISSTWKIVQATNKYTLIINDDIGDKTVTLHESIEDAEHAAYEFFLDSYIAGQHGNYVHDPLNKVELEYLVNYFDGEIRYEIYRVTE